MNLKMFKPYLYPLFNRKGQGMVEYALLVALISIAAIAVLLLFGEPLSAAFQSALDALTPAATEAP